MPVSLADLVLSDKHDLHPPSFVSSLKAVVKQSAKFVLDKSASEVVATLLRDDPDLVAKEVPHLRVPVNPMFVEVDVVTSAEVMGATTSSESDTVNGYLFSGDIVVIFARNVRKNAFIWPMAYLLHTAFDDAHPLSQQNYLRMAWSRGPLEKLDDAGRRSMLAHSPFLMRTHLEDTSFLNLLEESSGDLAMIASLLIHLNRPSVTVISNRVPSSRTFVRGHMVRTVPYTRLTFRSDSTVIIKAERASSRGRGLPPGYEVLRRRGSWVRDKVAMEYEAELGCQHQWAIADDFGFKPDNIRHRCQICGGKRWWRSEINKDPESEKSYLIRGVVPDHLGGTLQTKGKTS